MIKFPVGESGQTLAFTDSVLDHISSYRQTGWLDREAGGQLFARILDNEIIIEMATGPRSKDRRTRHSYVPHRKSEQAEIDEYHTKGLHYVGDWHTHPEPIAKPSPRDDANMRDCFTKSKHQLNAFVMAIAGQAELSKSLHVSLHDGAARYNLQPAQ